MPQMNKGGKFIFGKFLIRENGAIQFPEQVVQEYDIASEGKIYLLTGSKKTGGFCVTRKMLLAPSKLGHILSENPQLRDYACKAGAFIKYKGRFYTWLEISKDGMILLNDEVLSFLKLEKGMKLLSIRSSDIAFTMGAFGPLIDESLKHESEIQVY